MTDESVRNELWIRAYMDQVDGYAFGHPGRIGFRPTVPIFEHADGSLNREKTLELPCYHKFTSDQRVALLGK